MSLGSILSGSLGGIMSGGPMGGAIGGIGGLLGGGGAGFGGQGNIFSQQQLLQQQMQQQLQQQQQLFQQQLQSQLHPVLQPNLQNPQYQEVLNPKFLEYTVLPPQQKLIYSVNMTLLFATPVTSPAVLIARLSQLIVQTQGCVKVGAASPLLLAALVAANQLLMASIKK